MSAPKRLKKLLFFVHQNFLLLAQIIVGRLPPESSNNIWAHSLLAQILNKKAHSFSLTSTNFKQNDLHVSAKIEDSYILPLLQKQNHQVLKKLKAFCADSKKHGYRTELNYETMKACGQVLDSIERYQPMKVRDVLFSFLEKFTSSLFSR
jgi:hypothetical protein